MPGERPEGRALLERGDTAMKLLLVEDDEKIAATIKRGLEATGLTVELADDSDEGLQAGQAQLWTRWARGLYTMVVCEHPPKGPTS